MRAGASLLLLLFLTIGCNNDNGESGDPCAQFTPAAVPAPQTVTAVEGLGSGCDVVVIDLVVTDVSDLFATSFDLTFDQTRVVLATVSTTTSVLTSDGAPLLRQVTTIATGHVHVALTRSQVTTGVDVQGGATLATLTFLRAGTGGSTTLNFTDAELLDSGTPPAPIPGITFRAGSFQIFTQ
jgi:hypothetical protein